MYFWYLLTQQQEVFPQGNQYKQKQLHSHSPHEIDRLLHGKEDWLDFLMMTIC